MRIQEIREIAGKMGMKAVGMNKTELIRAVQRAEGNTGCYAVRQGHECDQINCLWREDCMRAISKHKATR
jgi:hypothetical protein